MQKISPLILINVIENCFKHSDIAYRQEAFLHVEIQVKDHLLHFKAENSFKESNKASGIGLENIQQQLEHSYPEKHKLHISNANAVFKVELQIELKS